ncbi:MAG: S8 family serine peptidase, partial [Anaerolineae bacterium]
DAVNADIVIIASAGNRGGDQSSDKVLDFPARNPDVISAGSTDQNDVRWTTPDQDGSQIGDSDIVLDVVAPGPSSPIWTTQSGAVNNYTSAFGKTSAAAAEVSGLAALIRSINPGLTWTQVRTILRNTADKSCRNGRCQFHG